MATVTGEIPWLEDVSLPLELSPLAKEGVTCDFCHTISGLENLGKNISLGAYTVPHRGDSAIKYGSHPDASSPAHPTKVSAFLQDSEFCGICHKLTHPLLLNVLQDTHAEWYASPYREQGQTCHDCHMPEYSGAGAAGGPERPDLNAHVFPGGHTQLLSGAARLSLRAETRKKSGKTRVRITALVTNSGSGHLLPTGIPGIRQLWLDLTVSRTDGTEVFAQRVDYEASLLDRDGNPAMPWNAVRLGKDTRIAPKKSRKSTYRFALPELTPGTLEARGVLYYRLVSEQAASSAGVEASPAIEVSSEHILIPLDRTARLRSQ